MLSSFIHSVFFHGVANHSRLFFFYRFYWTEPPRKIQAPFNFQTWIPKNWLPAELGDTNPSGFFFWRKTQLDHGVFFFFQAPNWRNMCKSNWKSKLPVSIVVKRDKEILEDTHLAWDSYPSPKPWQPVEKGCWCSLYKHPWKSLSQPALPVCGWTTHLKHMIVKSLGLVSWLAAYIMTSPPDHAMLGQSKRRRIGGIDATTGGEGFTELEVLSISGECIVTLNVSDSMCGRELWNLILEEVPTKPGLQLVVSHTSRLALNESLKQQGVGGDRAQVSATYIPVNLLAALRFAHGDSVEDEEFSLSGITEMTGVGDAATSALLRNLPKSLRTLTFADEFNQEIHHMRLPAGLQSLTFGFGFNQSLDNVTWPASLQSLTFGYNFNQSLDNVTWPASLQSLTFGRHTSIRGWTTWHGQQAFKAWLLVWISIRAWTTWHGQQAFKAWLFVILVVNTVNSIRALTTWHGQQAFKAWLLVGISIRAWTTWHGQQAFKAWLLVGISIRTWTTWHGQQAFKAWLFVILVVNTVNLIRAWTTWHGQQGFKAWLLVGISIRALTTWHGQQAFKACLLAGISIRAWTTWHGQQAFKAWLLVIAAVNTVNSIRVSTMWHGQQAFKAWLLVGISIRALTTWHGQQAFKAWLLVGISIRALTMWHGQQAFKAWLSVGISIRALTMWHGQQAFKAWLFVGISIRGLTTWHGQQAFKAWVLVGISIRVSTTWHGQQAFKAWLFGGISIRGLTTWHGQQAFKVWLLVGI